MIETVRRPPLIDLTKNINQANFFNAVMMKVANPAASPKKVFSYGGAIRGGKTFVCLFIWMLLCKKFAGSRWHVIREDMPAMKATSIPSLEKLIAGSPNWHWSRDSSNYFAEYHNGSRIFFKGENLSTDPELNDFLGMETNGLLLEQMEELSKKLFNIALSRTGSWYLDPMPPGLILNTFNPTQTWVKDDIYMKWVKGELPPEYHFQLALPKDNPYVTDDQRQGWNMMDERYIKQFIEGDWTNFDDMDNRWCFAFNRQKHVLSPEEWHKKFGILVDPQYPLYLSWDFNRNPMCCTLIQWPEENHVRICKVYKLKNMGVDGICERIKVDFPNFLYIVTGDYSGDTDTTLFEEEITNYTIIQNSLQLSDNQIAIMPNPLMDKNRTLVNSLHQHYPIYYHEEEAKDAVWDMEHVKATAEGKIDKGKPGERKHDPTKQADCFTGDTLISIEGGSKRIEEIKIGDKVITRNGFKKVIDKWHSYADTWEFELTDGTKINCTNDHKFFNHSFGFIPILRIFEENLSLWKRKSFTTESATRSIRSRTTTTVHNRSLKQKIFIPVACIVKSGSMLMELYLKTCRFITSMAMHSTTKSVITNSFQRGRINQSIPEKKSWMTLNSLLIFKRKELNLRRNGIAQKRVLNGTGKMRLKQILETENAAQGIAIIAKSSLYHEMSMPSFAAMHVNQPFEENIVLIKKQSPAKLVERNSKPLNIYQQPTAHEFAGLRQTHTELKVKKATFKGRKLVYDITVEHDHEFYANGILVHNCLDTIRYFMNKFLSNYLQIPHS